MRYDILYLEDDQSVHTLFLDIMHGDYGLNFISFLSGVKALDFLRANPSTLPLAYLCDMRIPGSLEELASPLEICRFVLNNGSLDLFRFYTGHVSEHDREVLQLTGVPFFLKPDFKEPRAFFAQVRAYRDSLDKA